MLEVSSHHFDTVTIFLISLVLIYLKHKDSLVFQDSDGGCTKISIKNEKSPEAWHPKDILMVPTEKKRGKLEHTRMIMEKPFLADEKTGHCQNDLEKRGRPLTEDLASQPASQHVMATGKQSHNRLTTFKTFAIILRRLSADSKISTNSNHSKMKICYQCLAWSKHWTNLSYKCCVNLFILE